MRNAKMATIILLGLVGATPVHALQTASPQEVVVVGEEVPPTEKMVCKRQKDTGTRFQRKTCRSVQQWDQIREQQMRDAREFIDKPVVNGQRGG